MERIPVAGPWISQKETDYVTDAVTNAWYGNANVYHERFERAFAEYLGVTFAISVPSCTAAIHLSLLALDVGPGDEVIVPDITWIATSAPVSYVGAVPVFADIDGTTWCLSSESFEECISPRTKAVIPVDLYGGVPDWDAILQVAERHGIAVVEDAAEAVGSEYRGRKAGGLGDTGTFSFHGSKTMTTGEGGMLVTSREDIRDRVLFLRDHGRMPGDKMFYNAEVAYKYKMSSMQAALGLAQLERIDDLVGRKRRIYGWYRDNLHDVAGIVLNYEASDTKNTYWMVTIVVDEELGIRKDRLMDVMSEHLIDCRPFFHPLSSLPAYEHSEQAKKARSRNHVSYKISPYAINLPSGLNMTEAKVRYVCDTLRSVLGI
jgi:perosamine synthetase